ncbi:hypothetical protein [Clostridium vincentii]|uniref:Uncharacterized protein n=1 Tax=Clostridium vincentii TaxID=52704 RepID=A0A2T0B6L2_9CLOT|nr:hypothetical protein [Clostridium vincentii]PRR79502.1 hypothetical protein CLVI_33470 [Clostridium vincentii]
MKRKNIIITLAITMMVSTGITAYASPILDATQSNSATTAQNCLGTGTGTSRVSNLHGSEILTNLLKSKGVTDEEINSALDSDKSLYTLLTEKGVSTEEINEYLLTERIKIIDEAVANGTITKEQGEKTKTKVREKSENGKTPGEGHAKMDRFEKKTK